MIQKSAVFNFSIEDCRVEISGLPMGVAVDYPFHNPLKRAKFLTRPRFWESLMPVEYVLLFGADRMICSKSELSIDDSLKYDFIRAPISGWNPGSDVEDIPESVENYSCGAGTRRSILLGRRARRNQYRYIGMRMES
jgi:hypothetical protein